MLGVRGDEHDMLHERPNRVLRLEAVDMRHANVEEHDVRSKLADDVRQVASVGALADDVEVGIAMEELPESLPRQRLVIHEQDAAAHHVDLHRSHDRPRR